MALIAFTPYVAVASVVPIVAALALRRRPAAVAGAVVLAVFAMIIAPRALGGPAEPGPGQASLRVMSANLLFGEADPTAAVELVRSEDVDVLSAQELTPVAVGALRRAGLERVLPNAALQPGPGASGTGVYSRLALTDISTAARPAGGFALPSATVRTAAGSVALTAVHLPPPTSGRAVAAWERAFEALAIPAAESAPSLLVGDFNATLDHSRMRELLDAGYVDAADGAGAGLASTWRSGSLPLGLTIDHVLVDRRLGAGEVSIHDLPGSDHEAVVADVILPAG